eukprot:1802966-Alexandrium_andersonii.AAC.1
MMMAQRWPETEFGVRDCVLHMRGRLRGRRGRRGGRRGRGRAYARGTLVRRARCARAYARGTLGSRQPGVLGDGQPARRVCQ